MKRFLWIAWGVMSAASAWAANSITITERAGVTTANYPIQIARPFAVGEIQNYPQALVDGVPVTTQADVKIRWLDASVRHAVLTFYIPALNANSTVTITFQDQATGNNTGFLNAAGMTGFADFGAHIQTTFGTASAGAMITANAFEYWMQGSVATSVIVADHSASRAFDMGSDSNKSIRPIFHLTFWPLVNKIRVRFIAENALTTTLQDQSYTVSLKTGAAATTVYGPRSVTHYAATRWTKEFWIGGAPPAITIDHNLANLAENRFLPNYDTSKQIPSATIQTTFTNWQASAKEILESGLWDKLMPNPGGRPDIGPFPDWTIQWLYSGDERAQEVALGQSQLVGGWPMHFREGDSSKFFNATHTDSALGKPISTYGRPTLFLNRGNQYLTSNDTVPADKITFVGPASDSGWLPDGAHQPDPGTPQYMLTGDYWYLEELQFWAAWGAFDSNPGSVFYGRGPNSYNGGIANETRGDAWLFRTRVHAAAWSPDSTPEKDYFERLVYEAITIWEGSHNITGTTRQGTPLWTWGNTVGIQRFGSLGAPPLHNWEIGNTRAASEDPINGSAVSLAMSPWMQNFLIISLGIARDLGYDTGALISWVGVNLANQVANPAYGPFASGAFQMPVTASSTGGYIDSWAAVRSGFQGSYDPYADFQIQKSYSDNYIFIAMAASSMIAAEPGGAQAWSFLSGQCLNQSVLTANPKFAITPRSIVNIPLSGQNGASVSLANARVFPNPWRSDRYAGLPISFDHLTPGTEVKIFTLTGRWVQTLTAALDSATWPLTNRSGERVASGLYYYVADNGQDKKTGKLAIIK